MSGKTTILLSSHILSEVGLTCHRVVIIDKGKIIAEDTAEGLSTRIQGSTRILVRAVGPRPAMLAALRTLPGVKEITEPEGETDNQEGQCFLIVSLDRTIAKDVAQLIIHHGWALHELRPLTLGLEELFVRLTAEQSSLAA
jgi:ABC-2 type transport system ATP-binding protein